MSWARNSVGERGDNIGLPDVTTADNGKIMEVESGEWKLKEGSGGGGGIPAPASPSDGDVLTYSSSDSAWVAAAPGGGGGGLIVTITSTPDPDDPTSAIGSTDKTAGEIKTAIDNHVPVWIYWDTTDTPQDINISVSFVRLFQYYDGVYIITDTADNQFNSTSLNSIMTTEYPE